MAHCKGPILYWKSNHWGGHHRRDAENPQPIPTTHKNFLWTRILAITKTHDMGPCHQTSTGFAKYITGAPVTPYTRGNRWSEEIRRRTPAAKHDPTIMKPICRQFLLRKEKGWQTLPCSRLSSIEQMDKKNWNVSPLIPSVVDRLAGCFLFTKFDIWWGYNNIHIKLGDKWKATFLTPGGLFEPTVMFFGLTNSLATF